MTSRVVCAAILSSLPFIAGCNVPTTPDVFAEAQRRCAPGGGLKEVTQYKGIGFATCNDDSWVRWNIK